MEEQNQLLFWRAMGKSVTGAAHKRKNKPCQDAIKWEILPEAVTLAVSDGHGSEKSLYSHYGSQFAVEITIQMLKEFYFRFGYAPNNFPLIKRYAEEQIPLMIVQKWAERVREHYIKNYADKAEKISTTLEVKKSAGRKEVNETNQRISATKYNGKSCQILIPDFSDREIEKLPKRPTVSSYDSTLIKYGATLMAVLATPTFLLFFQLGDGDIIIVEENEVVQRPIPRDERHIANETTSLCMPNAWNNMYVVFWPLEGKNTKLVMLSTDGYSNSFVSEGAFNQAGVDYMRLIKEQGWDFVKSKLGEWLSEVSEFGSGDDISVGILYSYSQKYLEKLKKDAEEFRKKRLYRKAKQIYDEITHINTYDYEAWGLRALCCKLLGKHREASGCYENMKRIIKTINMMKEARNTLLRKE